MISQEQLRLLRKNALLVARQREDYLRARSRAVKEAVQLVMQIYDMVGIVPNIPPHRWNWRAREMSMKIMGVCDEALLKTEDSSTRQTIEAVRSIFSVFDGARLGRKKEG